MKFGSILFILFVICFVSCDNKTSEKTTIPYISYSEEYIDLDQTIDIPFTLKGGVKIVSVKINGSSMDMIFDTGCSSTLISLLEANILVKNGSLSESDYIGTTLSTIADGSIVEDMTFNLKTIELTDGIQKIICKDVAAQVSSNIDAPVLLGNGVLDRVSSYEIDNDNRVIKFKLK